MYILQISDLHISQSSDIPELKEKITFLVSRLQSLLNPGDNLVCCLLGDFIDQGENAAFPKVKEVVLNLKKLLSRVVGEDHFAIELIPGNHDLCLNGKERDLSHFNKFASNILENPSAFTDKLSIHAADHFKYHFILASSVLHAEHRHGTIDFEALNQHSPSPQTIVLTHHSLISGDETDDACIRNGYQLQKYLENGNVIALLHGHTHGCKRYTVGQDCQVIGVGPMFKDVRDISNQCNLICFSGSTVQHIQTLIYQGDRREWDVVTTYEKTEDNSYNGTSVYKVYSQVLRDAEMIPSLPNLRIQIRQSYAHFKAEINDNFSSSVAAAEEWQSAQRSAYLPYTHGMLMNTKDTNWIDYIVQKLKQNPTSKRAIIPLIEKEAVFQSKDSWLVSFDVVQFGFSNPDCSNLYITIYLRALEIRYFLPLNLCEVYLMAEKIRSHFPSIQNVTVCLFAFRAEAKRNYGCYRKAQIDLLNESCLCKIVADLNRREELGALLQEKADMGDTVIDDLWLQKLKNALDAFYSETNKSEVMSLLEQVATTLGLLQSAREHCSDYSQTQAQEDRFTQALLSLRDKICGVDT